MKDKLNKEVNKYILICIIMSVLFVAGIPMIPIGFVNDMVWLGVIGIIFTVIGFYATPIMWTRLPNKLENRAIILAIYEYDILDISDLSRKFGKREKNMRYKIISLISSGKLEGYMMNKEDTALVEVKKKAREAVVKIRCEGCGAPLSKGDEVCTHCATIVR